MNQSLHFKVPTAFEHQKRRTERFSVTMACCVLMRRLSSGPEASDLQGCFIPGRRRAPRRPACPLPSQQQSHGKVAPQSGQY